MVAVLTFLEFHIHVYDPLLKFGVLKSDNAGQPGDPRSVLGRFVDGGLPPQLRPSKKAQQIWEGDVRKGAASHHFNCRGSPADHVRERGRQTDTAIQSIPIKY